MFIPTMKILDKSDFNGAFVYGSEVYLLERTKNDQGFFKKRKRKKLKKSIDDYYVQYRVTDDGYEDKLHLINGIDDQTIMNVALAGYYSVAILDDLQQSGDQRQIENRWIEKLAADLPDNPGYAKIAFDEICTQLPLSDDLEKAVDEMAKKAFDDTYGDLKQGQF